jgi:hypothetical protein
MNKSNFLPLREIALTGIIGGFFFVCFVVLAPQYFSLSISPLPVIGIIALSMIFGSFWAVRANNFAGNFVTRFSSSFLTYLVLFAVGALAIEYLGKNSAPFAEEEMSEIFEIAVKNILAGSAGSIAVAGVTGLIQHFLRPKTEF